MSQRTPVFIKCVTQQDLHSLNPGNSKFYSLESLLRIIVRYNYLPTRYNFARSRVCGPIFVSGFNCFFRVSVAYISLASVPYYPPCSKHMYRFEQQLIASYVLAIVVISDICYTAFLPSLCDLGQLGSDSDYVCRILFY